MVSGKQVLIGLTTTKGSDWRDKIQEIKQFNIKEAALLPVTLTPAERQEFYKLLEASGLESAPYVQLREDSTLAELDYLVARFKTKVFSCHADLAGYNVLDHLPKYNSVIFVENFANENSDILFNEQKFAEHQVSGICLDLSHLEEARKSAKKHFKRVAAMADKIPVGVTKISGIKSSVVFKVFNQTYVDHSLDSLNDLAYIKAFPPHYFAKFIVLDLENSFIEQLEIKKFTETIIK